jgi:hypothetical protein
VAALEGFEPVCLDFVPYALALTPRFLVKNISNVSNFAQTTGAGSHSINAALRGNAVGRLPGPPSSPSLQARGSHTPFSERGHLLGRPPYGMGYDGRPLPVTLWPLYHRSQLALRSRPEKWFAHVRSRRKNAQEARGRARGTVDELPADFMRRRLPHSEASGGAMASDTRDGCRVSVSSLT